MNSPKANSLSVSCFVFGVLYEKSMLFQYVRELNTKNEIQNTDIKSGFSVFYGINNFTLYKDFELC
jgi:hypothetical protein